MKQILLRKGSIIVDDIPAPLINDNSALVEVAYSLISTGTELSGIKSSGEPLVQRAIHEPQNVKKVLAILKDKGIQKTIDMIKGRLEAAIPVGYSCSGYVIQVGKQVEHIRPGDRVACAGVGKANHAEIVLVPKNLVVKIPDNCDLQDASSVALGSIAMQGVRRADPKVGEVVAVIGLGLVGQISVQLLKVAGCRAIGFDLQESRVELAKSLGMYAGFVSSSIDIKKEVDNLTNGLGVDCTIITASAPGNDSIIQQAIEITRKKGKVVIVGDIGLGLKRSPFYEKEIDLLISTSYGPGRYDESYEEKGIDYPYAYVRWTEQRNMEEYLKLISEGKLNFKALKGQIFPVEEAPSAYKTLEGKETPLSVFINYHVDNSDRQEKLKAKVIACPTPKKKEGLINVGIIGAGSFARAVHLPNLQRLSHVYLIRAIVSTTGSRAKETASRFGADYCSTDYRDVLKDEQIDMVMICTRHDTHARLAMEAAKAGKAIFLEKPMAVNENEMEELVEVIRETRVPVMVGFNRRFSPAASVVKNLIKERKNPIMVSYRVNAGYIPLDNWIHGPQGGGRIIGEACHMFDLFNFFTDGDAVSIDASAITPVTKHVSFRDNFIATIKYSEGSVCTLVYTALGSSQLPKEYIEIFCDGKTMVIDDFRELRVYNGRAKGWKGAQDKGHLQELEEFGRFIKGEPMAPVSLDQYVEATRLSFLVNNALQE
jgi:predicted dehydrogenase/threonine dehydrogenase-like Zn-dependent dehydrogenase